MSSFDEVSTSRCLFAAGRVKPRSHRINSTKLVDPVPPSAEVGYDDKVWWVRATAVTVIFAFHVHVISEKMRRKHFSLFAENGKTKR